MFAGIRNALMDWLNKAPPLLLLSIPFLVCGTIIIAILATVPLAGTVRYFFFAAIFGATLLSRMLQFWEYGVEFYHFLTFCFAFVFGPLAALLFSFSCSLLVIFSAIFIGGHMFNHSVPGPLFQSVDVIILSILAGLLGIFAHSFTLSNLPVVATALGALTMSIHQSFTRRVVGVDVGRLSTAVVISALVHYNLYTNFGPAVLSMMSSFA